jgi:hypothetical protein
MGSLSSYNLERSTSAPRLRLHGNGARKRNKRRLYLFRAVGSSSSTLTAPGDVFRVAPCFFTGSWLRSATANPAFCRPKRMIIRAPWFSRFQVKQEPLCGSVGASPRVQYRGGSCCVRWASPHQIHQEFGDFERELENTKTRGMGPTRW